MLANLPTIGIRFDVDKIDCASYGTACWRIFWSALRPESLPGAFLYEGDTMAGSDDRENVYCIAVQSDDDNVVNAVKSALVESDAFRSVWAVPRFVDAHACAHEPLTPAGMVDRAGNLVGDAWNAREALNSLE